MNISIPAEERVALFVNGRKSLVDIDEVAEYAHAPPDALILSTLHNTYHNPRRNDDPISLNDLRRLLPGQKTLLWGTLLALVEQGITAHIVSTFWNNRVSLSPKGLIDGIYFIRRHVWLNELGMRIETIPSPDVAGMINRGPGYILKRSVDSPDCIAIIDRWLV